MWTCGSSVGHAHTVAMSGLGGQSDANGVANVSGMHNCVARLCVCVAIAVVGPTMVTPDDRGGLGDEDMVRSCHLVYLGHCGGRPFATGGLVQHGDTPQWPMMIPTVVPIIVPLPSLDHRQFCVAGLARGHPDSGGTGIMGAPLPHLVMPLSGCLSRRTPTRATRGEARGHRSVLAQKPLLMHPLLFPLVGLVVGLVCPRHMVDWSQCVCAAVAAFLSGVARWRYFVDMWVAEGHTARWPWLCVLFVHRLSVCL